MDVEAIPELSSDHNHVIYVLGGKVLSTLDASAKTVNWKQFIESVQNHIALTDSSISNIDDLAGVRHVRRNCGSSSRNLGCASLETGSVGPRFHTAADPAEEESP